DRRHRRGVSERYVQRGAEREGIQRARRYGPGADRLSGPRARGATLLYQAEPADSRRAAARRRRIRRIHSTAGGKADGDQIADQKSAAEKSPGRRKRLRRAPVALQSRYPGEYPRRGEYAPPAGADQPEGENRPIRERHRRRAGRAPRKNR